MSLFATFTNKKPESNGLMDQFINVKNNTFLYGTATSSGYTYNANTTSVYTRPYRQLTYEQIYAQLYDEKSPVVPEEEWEKILPMLSSVDIEIIKVAFSLLQGYRVPTGVINLIEINKAINTLMKNDEF